MGCDFRRVVRESSEGDNLPMFGEERSRQDGPQEANARGVTLKMERNTVPDGHLIVRCMGALGRFLPRSHVTQPLC